ncbi:MAG: hypothetical protein J1E98_06595, partial [Lachnospiraceae bacterium]|nr:hypothetical protein [Lachnospiraceae bacterium]
MATRFPSIWQRRIRTAAGVNRSCSWERRKNGRKTMKVCTQVSTAAGRWVKSRFMIEYYRETATRCWLIPIKDPGT